MTDYSFCAADERFKMENFDITNLDDEIRVDALCSDFLKIFHHDLAENGRLPLEAGELTRGADYFLRDFVIADRRENIFQLQKGRVRQFAANWYIIKTIEPNMTELESVLDGVEAFYQFARKNNRVTTDTTDAVKRECADRGYYSERIESFWTIEGDGFLAWDAECSLKD